MAWTRTLPSGRYEGRYRDGNGVTQTVSGGPWVQKAEAMRMAAAAEAESRSLGWRDPSAAGRTWGEWCKEWWPSRRVKKSTDRSDVGRRDNHLIPKWGEVRLCDITRQDVKNWAAELQQWEDENDQVHTRAPATVLQIVGLFSRSLRGAVDAEVLPYNVADKLKLPSTPEGLERYLTQQEFWKLAGELEGEYLAMTLLLAGSGMRWGEAAGLHRARVHKDRRVIDVVEAFDSDAYEMAPVPKGKRTRVVPIADWVDLSALEKKAGKDTCGYTHTHGHCRGPLLLTTESGAVLDHSKFTNAFHAAVKRAELGHVRPHDLRHSYASWLLQGGRSLAEVGKLLGHKSPITTARYANLADIAAQGVIDALGQGPSTPPPAPTPEPVTEPVDELAARRRRRSVSA